MRMRTKPSILIREIGSLLVRQVCSLIMHLSMYTPGTTPRARVGDLTYMKPIASPLEQMLGSNAPIIIGLYNNIIIPPLLSANIVYPDLWHVYHSNTIKSPPFASRYRW